MSTVATLVEPLLPQHWPDVARIYAEGIAGGDATFETSAPPWDDWDAGHLRAHRFVASVGGEVAGWAAVSAVSDRCTFAGVVESSVYVTEKCRGHGVGRGLLEAVIASTEAAGIWTVQEGVVFPKNLASLVAHQRVGFEVIGRRKRLGRLNGEWRDVLLLERRSDVVN